MSEFAPAYVIGMDNPYTGWLVEEIEAGFRAVVEDLMRRDLVRKASEDGILLDEVLAQMVKTCVQPRHTLVVNCQSADGDVVQRFIHFAPNWIVEHLNPNGEGSHLLTVFRDRQALVEYLSDDLRLASSTCSHGQSFCLEQQTFFDATRLFSEGKSQEGRDTLSAAGLEEENCRRLEDALSSLLANTSLVVLINQHETERQHMRGFGLLEGKADLWLLHPYQKNESEFVEFTPANSDLVKKKFFEILPS